MDLFKISKSAGGRLEKLLGGVVELDFGRLMSLGECPLFPERRLGFLKMVFGLGQSDADPLIFGFDLFSTSAFLGKLRANLRKHLFSALELLFSFLVGLGELVDPVFASLLLLHELIVAIQSKENTRLFASSKQVGLETLDFLDILANESLFGHALVDLGLVADVLGTVSIVQSRKRLVNVDFCGADGSNNASLGTTTERVLEQTGELTLPVRNVLRLFDEGVDNPSESKQTLVDHTSFPGALVLGSRTSNVFGTSKIHQVELADFQEVLSFGGGFLGVNRNREDTVRSTGI